MTSICTACRIVTLLVAGAAVAWRGPTLEAQSGKFKSGVDMVPLTVAVTDSAGRHITGLTGNDFTVFEDGVEQELSFFASEEVPIDIAMLLDTSASMQADLALIRIAAGSLVKSLRPFDRGAVVELSDFTRITQPFTSDQARLNLSLRRLRTSGSTALYDGLYVVLKRFEREPTSEGSVRRRVIVVVSDGLDNQSHIAIDDVLDLARRSGVSVYVIMLPGERRYLAVGDVKGMVSRAEYAMRAVARDSGARSFFPKAAIELANICNTIAGELANQYELGYVPTRSGDDGAFRRVSVRVPPHTNAVARTRSGYYPQRTAAER